jgi:hypothetical protein
MASVVQLTKPGGQHGLAVSAHTLSEAVRELRVDTVVIASDERRARLPVDELIRLRLSGITVLPAQRFAERVLRRIPLALLRPSDLAIGEGLITPLGTAMKRVFDLAMSGLLLADWSHALTRSIFGFRRVDGLTGSPTDVSSNVH